MGVVKGLFVLILLAALVAGGGYGYYWYQVKTYIDNQIASVSGQVQVTYDQLVVDPRGEIRLEQINIQPVGFSDQYPIRTALVRSDDPLFFLDAQNRIDRGEWPGFLALSVEGFDLNLSGDLAALGAADASAMQTPDLDALACGDVLSFTPAEYQAMGIRSTTLGMSLTAQVNDSAGTLATTFDIDLSGIGRIEAEADLSYASGFLRPSTAMAANPRVNRLRAAYQDLGFYNKRDQFCAEQAGLSPEAYRDSHVLAVSQLASAVGMDVPQVLITAYRDATEKGARTEVIMRPAGGLGAEAVMGLGAPAEMIDRLGLRLLVNSRPVDLTTVDWSGMIPDPERALAVQQGADIEAAVDGVAQSDGASDMSETEGVEEMAEAMASEVVTEASGPVAQLTPEEAPELTSDQRIAGIILEEVVEPKTFKKTSFGELRDHIDGDIRIRTYFGNRVEGRIKSVQGSRLLIEHRIDQGMAIYPVDRDKLQTIEVLR